MMDYLMQTICLGVDLLVLGFCVKEYYVHRNIITSLKNAKWLTIDENLQRYVLYCMRKNLKLPYVVLFGKVASIGSPIKSILNPLIKGPIQVINEYGKSEKSITCKSIPFTINNDNIYVEVLDGISAKLVGLDIVGSDNSNNFKFEEMLCEGSYVTGIGELRLDNGYLQLQESKYRPLFLTRQTIADIIYSYKSRLPLYRFKIVFFGSIAIILIVSIGWRFYKKRQLERSKQIEKCTKCLFKPAENSGLCYTCIGAGWKSNEIELIFKP